MSRERCKFPCKRNADEDIDVPGLKRLIEFLNTKNIGGLWVLVTGSEDMKIVCFFTPPATLKNYTFYEDVTFPDEA